MIGKSGKGKVQTTHIFILSAVKWLSYDVATNAKVNNYLRIIENIMNELLSIS